MPPLAVVQEFARTIKNKLNLKCNFFATASDIPNPHELDPEDKNLMIFDDLLLQRQNKCKCYYICGRHSNVDCFYLSQNYLNYLDKLSEKTPTLFAFSLKILKTIITIMLVRICHRKSLEDFVASVGKNLMVSLSSI